MTDTTANRVLSALANFGLKQEGEGKYRCNSPLRAGSDSKGFTLKIEDGEHGAYKDHVSGEQGSLYELAQKLNIPVPTKAPVADTKRDYQGLEDYARAHGIPPEVLESWYWRETTHKNRRALLIPTRTGNRWRFLDKDKPHYTSEVNYQRCWYGLNTGVKTRLERGLPLVICNGEISTITGQHYGLATIAMTAGEKSEIPTGLFNELKGMITPQTQILVAMDCDNSGRQAGRGITAQLRAAGYTARAVDLKLGTHGDLADICMLYEFDTLEHLKQCPDLLPESPTDETKRLYTIDDILALPALRWLVPGKIPERGLCMVFGQSGVGKSFYALAMAMELAQEKPVIYIVAEGEAGMSMRVEAYIKHHNTKPPHIRFYLGAIDLFEEADLYTFQSLAETHKPCLIIVDTLAMSVGIADENSTRDMKVIVDSCKRMSRQLSSAILLVHHTNKGGKQVRGNMSIFNACDTVIRVERSDNLIVVESKKSKDAKGFKRYYLREVAVPLGVNEDGETVCGLVLLPSDKVLESEQLTELQMKVLSELTTTPNASLSDLAGMTESDRHSVNRAIARLEKLGFLCAWDGTARKLTDAGKAQIDSGVRTVRTDSDKTENGKVEKTPEQAEHHEQPENSGVQPEHLTEQLNEQLEKEQSDEATGTEQLNGKPIQRPLIQIAKTNYDYE